MTVINVKGENLFQLFDSTEKKKADLLKTPQKND